MIATEKHYAFRGRLMSLLVLRYSGVSSRPLGLCTARPTQNTCSHRTRKASLRIIARRKSGFLFQGVSVFFLRWWSSYLVPVITITDTMLVWSGGPLSPAGTKVFGGSSERSPSTCLKTQQYLSEGRLKPFFAINVDIPYARARRLKPCPLKATVRSGKHTRAYFEVYINYEIKSDNYEKSLHYLVFFSLRQLLKYTMIELIQ